MDVSYGISALELDSQVQLLSRIQFVTRFSSNFIQVTGEPGAGKTWLSERYLETWAQEPTQALLICHEGQQAEQHRAIILRQLLPDGVFNAQDGLTECLSRMLDELAMHALIVIDDAHQLSVDLVAELWQLVMQAQRNEDWQINVLLFCRTHQDPWFQNMSFAQGLRPLELEVNPLTESERDLMIDLMINRLGMDMVGARRLKQSAMDLPSLPGALLGLQQPQSLTMEEKKPKSRLPLYIATFLFFMLTGAGVWWFFPQQERVQLKPQPGSLMDLTQRETAEQGTVESGLPKVNSVSSQQSIARDDTYSLPTTPVIEGLTVGRSDDQTRVVVSDEVVDAMIDHQENASARQAQNSDPESVQVQPLPTVTFDHPKLLEISPKRYALQLAALQSKQAVAEFLQLHQLVGKVQIYETRRNGSPWFMVLEGDYPSINAARQAETSLSESVRALGPWAKSFKQIHKEIQVVN